MRASNAWEVGQLETAYINAHGCDLGFGNSDIISSVHVAQLPPYNMGNLPSTYVGVLLSAATVVYLLGTTWCRVSNRILAQRAGCKPAFTRPYRLPLGIDDLTRSIYSILNNAMQNDDVAIYEEIRCRSTWLQNILGEFYHVTADPENIKAMLATISRSMRRPSFSLAKAWTLNAPSVNRHRNLTLQAARTLGRTGSTAKTGRPLAEPLTEQMPPLPSEGCSWTFTICTDPALSPGTARRSSNSQTTLSSEL